MNPIVVLPTYNERDNLAHVIRGLMASSGVRVLVVDDASPDRTGDLADALAATSNGRVDVLHRRGPRGLGRSYVDGMHLALSRGATHVFQMDADLSHDPADVPRLLAASSEAEVVIGSRYVPGGRIENWPRRRRSLSAFANRYIRAITGMRVRDCTSGFRCWRRDALMRLPLDRIRSDGYSFVVELTWYAYMAGCSIRELPITFVERRQGHSKLSAGVLLESASMPWRLAFRKRSASLLAKR